MSRDFIYVYARRVNLRNSILQQSKFSPLCIYSHRPLDKITENFAPNCNCRKNKQCLFSLHAYVSTWITFISTAQQTLMGKDLLIIEASLSRSGTPQSVGLLLARDQPISENSTCQLTALTTDTPKCRRQE